MLILNQLIGFGAFQDVVAGEQPFAITYLGTADAVFTASDTSAAFSVPGTLGAAHDRRHLLLIACESDLSPAFSVGSDPGLFASAEIMESGATGDCDIIGTLFYVPTDADINNVTCETGSAVTATYKIHFYQIDSPSEIYAAFPVRPNALSAGATGTGTGTAFTLRTPATGGAVAASSKTNLTAGITWTGLTEDGEVNSAEATIGAASSDSVGFNAGLSVNATTGASQNFAQSGMSIADTANPGIQISHTVVSLALTFAAQTTQSGSYIDQPFWRHGSGTGHKLWVAVMAELDVSPTGVTADGNAMSLEASVANTTASPDLRVDLYSVDWPIANSEDPVLAVTYGANQTATIRLVAFLTCNVTATFDEQSVTGNATGAAVSLDIEQDADCAIAFHMRATNTQTVTWTGLTEILDLDGTAYRASAAAENFLAAETDRTVQAVGSASGQYATLAVSFQRT